MEIKEETKMINTVKFIEETLIIFNNNLKKIITEFKETYPEIISELNKNNTIDGFMNVNEIIRKLFDKKRHLLDRKTNEKTKLYKHDYFVLFLCLACDLSLCNNWIDIEKQYDIMRYLNKRYETSHNLVDVSCCNIDEDRVYVKCCCSHICIAHNCFTITNPYTNIAIFVACDCLTKVCSDKEIRKQIKKKVERMKLENPTYVVSIIKNEKLNEIKRESKKKQELEEKIRNENRECSSCKKYCIPITEPNWKLKCYSCYTLTGKCLIKIKK